MAAIDVFNKFYESWQQQDLETIEGLLADDFEYQCPKTDHPELKKIMRPVRGFKGFQEWNQAFGDNVRPTKMEMVPHAISGNENMCFIDNEMEGTMFGADFQMKSHMQCIVENGKMKKMIDVFDMKAMEDQMPREEEPKEEGSTVVRAVDIFNEFFEAWKKQDLGTIEMLLADNFEYQCPPTNHPDLKKIMRSVKGFAEFKEWNQAFGENVEPTITEMIPHGIKPGLCFIDNKMEGKMFGSDFQMKTFLQCFVENGKITKMVDVFDMKAIEAQMPREEEPKEEGENSESERPQKEIKTGCC